MDIYWYGQACFKIKGKLATVIVDPFDPEFTGLKLPHDLICDAVLKSHDHKDHSNLEAVSSQLQIKGPGEYEIKGTNITGVSVFHDNVGGAERGKNVIYNIEEDGLNVVHLGDLGHKLSTEQVQEVGSVDILMVPVGGVYTISAKEAAEVVSELEPKIIIPMHYKIPGLKFELEGVEAFLKEMGIESVELQPKLSVTKDKLSEEPKVVVLRNS